MQIRSLFAAFPEGKWRVSKSLPRDIPVLLISQAFNFECSILEHIWVPWKDWAVHSLSPPKRDPAEEVSTPCFQCATLSIPYSSYIPGTTRHWDPCKTTQKQGWFEHLQTIFTQGTHLPHHIPSCGNIRIRVTNSGNFGLNFLTDWKQSQLLGGSLGFFFPNREKNKSQSVKCKHNLKIFVYLIARQNNTWIKSCRSPFDSAVLLLVTQNKFLSWYYSKSTKAMANNTSSFLLDEKMLFIQENLHKYSSNMTPKPRAGSTSTLPSPSCIKALEEPPVTLLTDIQSFAACFVFFPQIWNTASAEKKVLFPKFLVFQRNILTLHSASLAKNVFCVHSFSVDDIVWTLTVQSMI